MGHIFLIICKPCNFCFVSRPDIVNFTNLFAGYFHSLLNIPKFYFGMQLSHLEIVWSLWVLLLDFLKRDHNSVCSRPNYYPLLKQDTSVYSLREPLNFEVIQSSWVE